MCVSQKGPGRPIQLSLVPIPVGSPFHTVGIDVLQLPLTTRGKCYVVSFVDHLTKWVKAYAITDERADSISRLFVENVVCRHAVPEKSYSLTEGLTSSLI